MKEHTHDGYGAFPGGDPRCFTPDHECSTPEEQEAWELACSSWKAAEENGQLPPASPSAHETTSLQDGGWVHVTRVRFGLGVYSIPCTDPACDEAQEPDPPEPDWDAEVNAARWESAAREGLTGDDDDLSDQDDGAPPVTT